MKAITHEEIKGSTYMTEQAQKAKRAYYAAWREKNRQSYNEYHRLWRKQNPEAVQKIQARYWEKRAVSIVSDRLEKDDEIKLTD